MGKKAWLEPHNVVITNAAISRKNPAFLILFRFSLIIICVIFVYLFVSIWKSRMAIVSRMIMMYCLFSRSYSFQWKAL